MYFIAFLRTFRYRFRVTFSFQTRAIQRRIVTWLILWLRKVTFEKCPTVHVDLLSSANRSCKPFSSSPWYPWDPSGEFYIYIYLSLLSLSPLWHFSLLIPFPLHPSRIILPTNHNTLASKHSSMFWPQESRSERRTSQEGEWVIISSLFRY